MVAGQEEANILLSLLCTRLQLRLLSLSRERPGVDHFHKSTLRLHALYTPIVPHVSLRTYNYTHHTQLDAYAYLEPRHGRLSVYNLRQVQRHDNATVHHGADDENIPPLAVPRGGR